MSKNVSIKVPFGFKEIKATMFFESVYKGEKLYVLMGSGEVFALKKDDNFGYVNVVLPNKDAYSELIEPINNEFRNGHNLNDNFISLNEVPSVIWVNVPFEQVYGMKSLWDKKEVDKIEYSRDQYFYCIFSFCENNFIDFKNAFSPFGIIINGQGRDEVVYEDRINLLRPYLNEIKEVSTNSIFNVVITIKDNKVRECSRFYSYLNVLKEDDDQRFYISFLPVFNRSLLAEIEKNKKISVVGDFSFKKLNPKDYKKILSDALFEKSTLITDDMIFEPESNDYSKYKK